MVELNDCEKLILSEMKVTVFEAENKRLREAINKMERLAEIIGDDILNKDIMLATLQAIADMSKEALKGDE